MQNIIQSVHSEVFTLRECDLKVSGKLYMNRYNEYQRITAFMHKNCAMGSFDLYFDLAQMCAVKTIFRKRWPGIQAAQK